MRGDYGSSFALPADDVLLMRHADAEEIAVIAVAARRGLVLPFWFVACGLVGCACVSFLLGRTVGDARPPAATRTASVPPPDCYDPVFFKDPANKSLSVTISIGYATREEKLKLPEAVIKAADQALYRAKKKGRNCLSI